LITAVLVIAILLVVQPISNDIMGLSGNLFAAAIVAIGGLIAAAGG